MTDPEGNMIELQNWATRQVIRACHSDDLERMFQIINDAAQAYRGVIPADRWKEPYMPREELEHEISQGVRFSGIEADGILVGIMGVQPVKDVNLIRHAYVATEHRGKGLGGVLLDHLLREAKGPILVGTWAAATWAIRFHEKHRFRRVTPKQKDRLLRTYWSIPGRTPGQVLGFFPGPLSASLWPSGPARLTQVVKRHRPARGADRKRCEATGSMELKAVLSWARAPPFMLRVARAVGQFSLLLRLGTDTLSL